MGNNRRRVLLTRSSEVEKLCGQSHQAEKAFTLSSQKKAASTLLSKKLPVPSQNFQISEMKIGGVPTTPDPNTSEKYRDTNGRRIAIQIGGVHTTFCQEGDMLLQTYRDRNGRCITILFKSIRVRGRFDSPEFKRERFTKIASFGNTFVSNAVALLKCNIQTIFQKKSLWSSPIKPHCALGHNKLQL